MKFKIWPGVITSLSGGTAREILHNYNASSKRKKSASKEFNKDYE